MREPKISFVSELKAQIINDLCRLQHYTAILTNYKPIAVCCQMVSFMVVPKYTRHEGFVTKSGGSSSCAAFGRARSIGDSSEQLRDLFFKSRKLQTLFFGKHLCIHCTNLNRQSE